jgi:hypothetical protein
MFKSSQEARGDMEKMGRAKMAALKAEGAVKLIHASVNASHRISDDEIYFTLATAEGIELATARERYREAVRAARQAAR